MEVSTVYNHVPLLHPVIQVWSAFIKCAFPDKKKHSRVVCQIHPWCLGQRPQKVRRRQIVFELFAFMRYVRLQIGSNLRAVQGSPSFLLLLHPKGVTVYLHWKNRCGEKVQIYRVKSYVSRYSSEQSVRVPLLKAMWMAVLPRERQEPCKQALCEEGVVVERELIVFPVRFGSFLLQLSQFWSLLALSGV